MNWFLLIIVTRRLSLLLSLTLAICPAGSCDNLGSKSGRGNRWSRRCLAYSPRCITASYIRFANVTGPNSYRSWYEYTLSKVNQRFSTRDDARNCERDDNEHIPSGLDLNAAQMELSAFLLEPRVVYRISERERERDWRWWDRRWSTRWRAKTLRDEARYLKFRFNVIASLSGMRIGYWREAREELAEYNLICPRLPREEKCIIKTALSAYSPVLRLGTESRCGSRTHDLIDGRHQINREHLRIQRRNMGGTMRVRGVWVGFSLIAHLSGDLRRTMSRLWREADAWKRVRLLRNAKREKWISDLFVRAVI